MSGISYQFCDPDWPQYTLALTRTDIVEGKELGISF